jgi:ABC-type methionine transport system ATPase subunit
MSPPARVRITFPDHLITEPIIGRLAKQFEVLPNIRTASIGDTSAIMLCELDGERPDVDAAIAWLRDQGVRVDLLGDVVES